MRKFLFAFFATAIAAGASLVPAPLARAATKPVAAVAIKSYDEVLSNVNFVGEIAEKPELGSMLEGLIAFGTQGLGLAGIDKARPWGVVLQSGGDDVTGYAFVPVSDGKALLKLLGLYTTVSKEAGLYTFAPKNGNQTIYGKLQGKWALFSDKAASLKSTVADPSALLAGAGKDCLVTGRVFLANVPEKYRQKLVDEIEKNAKRDLDKKSDEPEDLHAARTQASAKIVESLKTAIHGLDEITFGWGIDRTAEKLFAETNITVLADSPLADQMASLEKATTKFAGMELPGQAAAARISGPIVELKAEVLEAIIALGRKQALADSERKDPVEKQETAKVVINNGADLLEKIVKSGRFDLAATVALEPESALGVAAAYVADGDLLDKTLHTIVEALEKENPGIGGIVKLDADSADKVKLHTVTIPIGPEDKDHDKNVRMFGEQLQIVVGVGTDTAYIAAGRDSLEKLKKIIAENASAGEKSVTPVAVTVSAEKVAAFSAVNGEEKDRAKMKVAAAELKNTPDKDHITLVAKPIPHGVQYRLDIEKGVLRAFVKMAAEGKD